MSAGKKIFLGAVILLALAALGVKLYYSEQLKIAWNRPKYLYDGRHYLTGDEGAALLNLRNELLVAADSQGTDKWRQAIRLAPGGGVELQGEQSLSFISDRTNSASRHMLKLRPMRQAAAEREQLDSPPAQDTDWRLYLERRTYGSNGLLGLTKDLSIGPEGLRFLAAATAYVPDQPQAGPRDAAAAANLRYVDGAVTGQTASAFFDRRYFRRVSPPENCHSPGREGDLAADQDYLYLYQGGCWLRTRLEKTW